MNKVVACPSTSQQVPAEAIGDFRDEDALTIVALRGEFS
jgi:hypothetical protein